MSGKPNTLQVVRELIENQRLDPLSVLITNFSESGWSTETKQWARRLGVLSLLRSDTDASPQLPEDHFAAVEGTLAKHYGGFITEFISTLAGQLFPWWRTTALPGAQKDLFSGGKALESALQAERTYKASDEGMMFEIGLDHMRRVSYFVREFLEQGDPLLQLFQVDKIQKVLLRESIELATFLRNFGDGISESQEDVFRAACGDELLNLVGSFRWFDQGESAFDKMFCDVPQGHLIADTLYGIYGFPYHSNLSQHRRWKYTAQKTPMYLDAFVFDQARYIYDLCPTLPLMSAFLQQHGGLGRQITLRCCLDGLYRHLRWSGSDLFYGSTIISEGESGSTFHSWPERETITTEVD